MGHIGLIGDDGKHQVKRKEISGYLAESFCSLFPVSKHDDLTITNFFFLSFCMVFCELPNMSDPNAEFLKQVRSYLIVPLSLSINMHNSPHCCPHFS